MNQSFANPDAGASAAERALRFRDDIQGLRAVAVLGVLIFHMERGWLPGGFAGVDVFFVISGFLISRIILAECAAGQFSLARFYERRAKRILPALLVVVIFVGAYGWLRSDPAQFRMIGAHMMGNSYFTVNFWLMRQATEGYFAPDALSKPLLHLWSLSIEEQFYLVWALVAPALFFFGRRAAAFGVLAIFAGSLAYCLVLTPINPVDAFYLPWTRGWELALGALLAVREVFFLKRLPYPARATANIGAALGIALMLGTYLFVRETDAFPGWRAMLPTAGCALVIACPGATWTTALLRSRAAGFVGAISYPLYLWHWPLFAFARSTLEGAPTPTLMLALGALAFALATLTYLAVERPLDRPFRAHRNAVALSLAALLAATGLFGRQVYADDGLPGRFPPLVAKIFTDIGGARSPLASCLYDREPLQYPLAEQRVRAARYFSEHGCLNVDPKKPTVMVVGDLHAAHLIDGISALLGARANLVVLTATYCAPLMEHVAIGAGEAGTERCQAINDVVFDRIRALKPDLLIVGAFFDEFLRERTFLYPFYAEALEKAAKGLHDEGVPAILVAGQVPTWSPWMRILVGREILERGSASEFSRVGLDAQSLAVDRDLKARRWDGATYVSQAASLCGDEGCRRLVGPDLPADMLSFDYGHYTARGSDFAVRTIFAPLIERALAEAWAGRK